MMKNSQQSNPRSFQKRDSDYFPINIFLKQPLYEYLELDVQNIKQKVQVQQLNFVQELELPKILGQVIQIADVDFNKKIEALKAVLKKIEEFERSINSKHKSFILLLFIPDNLVSLLIGSSGRQLSSIMKNTNTKIIINQPIYKMFHRTITILGTCTNLGYCIYEIYKLFDEQGKPQEKQELIRYPKEVQSSRKKTTARFIFANSEVSALIGIKGEYVKRLNEKFGVLIKFFYEKDNQCLKKDEKICLISGDLENVQKVIWKIAKQQERYCFENKNQKSCELKLIFPTQFITKLIGPKGTNIQSINQKSEGATVRVLSDRASERECQYCLTTINGDLEQKQNAACMIVEQLEIFKDGGPILKNGKQLLKMLGEQLDYDYIKSWPEFSSTKKLQEDSKKQESRKSSSSSKSKKKYQSGKHSRQRRTNSKSKSSSLSSRSSSRSRSKSRSRSHSKSHSSKKNQIFFKNKVQQNSEIKEEKQNNQEQIVDNFLQNIEEPLFEENPYQKISQIEYKKNFVENFNIFQINKEENKIKLSIIFPENIVKQINDIYQEIQTIGQQTGALITIENTKTIIMPDLKNGQIISIYGSPASNQDALYKLQRCFLEKITE